MGYSMGIDLGSTTSKAVIIDDQKQIVGEGLTNTRSNYLVAVKVAEEDARLDLNLSLLGSAIADSAALKEVKNGLFEALMYAFRYNVHIRKVANLKAYCFETINQDIYAGKRGDLQFVLKKVFEKIDAQSGPIVKDIMYDKSRFFRDIIASIYMQTVEEIYKKFNVSFDDLVSVYDKAIIRSENEVTPLSLSEGIEIGLKEQRDKKALDDTQAGIIMKIMNKIDKEIVIDSMVGTGYGRQLLPFPKENIYSEILCHGLGSHHLFPNTRTVLDIGGQDTKAIQVNESGMVTSFNMNDRCAAGCGRFLGYIADQLSIGVQDLSEVASKAKKVIKISSTCTVFSGAEMRSKLNLGERREDLVLSLEHAMAKRAMSLIARSGGVSNEFTFSGGVAKNQSMVTIFDNLVKEHYGDIKMNVSPNSIYAGALGAALFAKRKV